MKTGLVYDERMCLHQEKQHPEQPDRIRYIFSSVQKAGLYEKCVHIPVRAASDSEIIKVHTLPHYNRMNSLQKMDQKKLNTLAKTFNSIYFNPHTYQSALLSAGGVIELCDKVVRQEIANGIAIVRPPGHHAEPNSPMGFCIFNNVAVAAKSMIDKHGLKRIVILDWDVHHGNATQHMFENDPRVLYISIHRYDNARFYPASTDADPNMVGFGDGIGRNVNIAFNNDDYHSNRIGTVDYLYIYKSLIKDMISEYSPELIIVSAGFDCAKGDPLGGLHVAPECFNHITQDLMNYANGKIVIALEGGYNLETISESMVACLRALLGQEKMPLFIDKEISDVTLDAVNTTAFYHKNFWNFLKKYYNGVK